MSKKRVLVVDDGATNRSFIKTYLLLRNFEVETAEDGLEGFQKAQSSTFDLIFSDIEMPNMNGIEFLREVKKLPNYQKVPVVILSSLTKESIKQETKSLGALYYMEKPFDDAKMTEALKLAGFF
jgi:two-component system chemotaxis response regulator CheY